VKKKKAVKKKKVKLDAGRQGGEGAQARAQAREEGSEESGAQARQKTRSQEDQEAGEEAAPKIVAPVVDIGDLSGGASGLDEVSEPGLPKLF